MNKKILVLLGIISIISLSLYLFLNRSTSSEKVLVVDAQGVSHVLSIDEGQWYIGRNESPFLYVEVITGMTILKGWTTREEFTQEQERENVTGLKRHLWLQGRLSLSQLEIMLGQEFLFQCTMYKDPHKQFSAGDITECRVHHPEPTIAAMRGMAFIAEEEKEIAYLWDRNLVLGDSAWSGEWVIKPTYFEDEGQLYVAYRRFGSCTFSVWDGDTYWEVPEKWVTPFEGKFGEKLYYLYFIPHWKTQWVVNTPSPLDCLPIERFAEIRFEPTMHMFGS